MKKINENADTELVKDIDVNPGFWSIPNSYMKKVRKMSLNQLRDNVHRLSRALMDQHNANIILSEKLKSQTAELKELRVQVNKASDGQSSAEVGQNESKEGQANG